MILKFHQQLSTLKGYNIVAINSDKSITKQKGKPPLLNELERAILLSSIDINGGTEVLIPPVNKAGLYDDAAVCPFTTASVSSTLITTNHAVVQQ